MKILNAFLLIFSACVLSAEAKSLETSLPNNDVFEVCLDYGRTYLSGNHRKIDNSTFEHIVNCYFILNKGRKPGTGNQPAFIPNSARYSTGFSKAIIEKLYPDDLDQTDPDFVKKTILSLVEIMNKSEDFSFTGLLLIKKTADRYDMLLSKRIEQETHAALQDASEYTYLTAASTFIGSLVYNKWRKSGKLGYFISSLVTIGSSAGVFKYRYDSKTSRLFVDGVPPGPVHILEQNSENLVSGLIKIEANSGSELTYELSSLVATLTLFPAARGLFNGLIYNPISKAIGKTSLGQRVSQAKANCTGAFKLLHAFSVAKPKTYWVLSKLGLGASWLLHPSQLVGFTAAHAVGTSGVNLGFKQAYLSDLAKAESLIEKALSDQDSLALELSIRNYKSSVSAYANYLSMNFAKEYGEAIQEASENIENKQSGNNVELFEEISKSWFGTVLNKWVHQGQFHYSLVDGYLNDYNPETREEKISQAFSRSEWLKYSELKAPGLVYLKAAAFLSEREATRKVNAWFLVKADNEALKLGSILEMFEGKQK